MEKKRWWRTVEVKEPKWYSTSEKLPQIGDIVYASDGQQTMKLTVRCLPKDSWTSNVIKWRYASERVEENE